MGRENEGRTSKQRIGKKKPQKRSDNNTRLHYELLVLSDLTVYEEGDSATHMSKQDGAYIEPKKQSHILAGLLVNYVRHAQRPSKMKVITSPAAETPTLRPPPLIPHLHPRVGLFQIPGVALDDGCC